MRTELFQLVLLRIKWIFVCFGLRAFARRRDANSTKRKKERKRLRDSQKQSSTSHHPYNTLDTRYHYPSPFRPPLPSLAMHHSSSMPPMNAPAGIPHTHLLIGRAELNCTSKSLFQKQHGYDWKIKDKWWTDQQTDRLHHHPASQPANISSSRKSSTHKT